MAKIHAKAKALGGKGVVFCFKRDVEKWYYREMIPGTKRYKSQLIEDAKTIEEAHEGAIHAYNAIREQVIALAAEEVTRKKALELTEDTLPGTKIIIRDRAKRTKSREIEVCIEEFLESERKRVEAGLLTEKSWLNKRESIKRMLPYLKKQGLIKTGHLTNNSFDEFIYWRKASKGTRRLEMIYFKDFLKAFCAKHDLLPQGFDIANCMPKIIIKASEIDANPPLIEPGNWDAVMRGLKKRIKHRDNSRGKAKQPSHQNDYFNKMFYRWCMVMKNSGLRPNSELNKLRWCDVKRENVGRWSESEGGEKDKWIANIHIRESKTGRQRVVPTNGVDSQLKAWRKEQQEYIDEYFKGLEITDDTLIFGNPSMQMKPYYYSRFSQAWIDVINSLKGELKPYVFSNRRYTIYSMRSTFICNLILSGKDIYTVAKLAGHTVAVCERYYALLDMGNKAKDVTDFEYGKKGRKKNEIGNYLEKVASEKGYKLESYQHN